MGNKKTIDDFTYSIQLTQELVKYNTYDNDLDKLNSLKFVEQEIKKYTKADVKIYENEVNGPLLISTLEIENPKFKLLLQGHVDVVSPEGVQDPFEAIIKDNIMYGRGTCDMKGGCASIINAFIKSAQLENQTGNIYLVLTMDEEYSSQQIIDILKKEYIPKCDFGIIAEPTEMQVITCHKGNAWVDVDFVGKTAHASTPEKGVNAIYMASEFINQLKIDLIDSYESQGDEFFGKPTLNVGVINGGSKPNVVASECNVRLDKRYLPGDCIETFIEEIEDVIKTCKQKNPDFKARINVIGDWPSVVVERDNKNLLKLKSILESSLNKDVEFTVGNFWGEGGFIQQQGIPVVYYGPGSISYAHTPNEHIIIDEIVEVSKGYFEIIKGMCFEN